ncbi:glycosyltransferase family 4 protein, partial [Bifidobacterium moukalabense]|uniref:glycosyltransferase family 4 protein n=1 Tax=Bifidobacterium moukalabense TaxID=1333651 RepID=UPI001BB0DB46
KKRLCIFTKYSSNGPSSKYRAMIFVRDLSNKYDVTVFPFWNVKYYKKYAKNKRKYLIQIVFAFVLNSLRRLFEILLYGAKSDIVLFQKCVIPGIRWNPIRFLRRKKIRVFLDVDDAVYLSRRDNTDALANTANGVIVGNQTLADHYKKFNDKVRIIPTVDYTPIYELYRHDTFPSKTVVWIGSAASISNLDQLIDPINRVVERHPEVSFRYICSDDYGYTSRIDNSIFVPWSEETYLEELAKGTIGVMPLDDSNFNRGKCGFKLIQYFNMGKPSVASNVGVNGEIVRDFGFAATNSREWTTAIEELLFNEKIYRRFEFNIQTLFNERYGYDQALKQLESFLGA